jgi:hypothetical protein
MPLNSMSYCVLASNSDSHTIAFLRAGFNFASGLVWAPVTCTVISHAPNHL